MANPKDDAAMAAFQQQGKRPLTATWPDQSTKRAGRENMLFVPVNDMSFARKTAEEQLQFAEATGFNPLFIHQLFQEELIPEWNKSTKFIFYYHTFSLHALLKVYRTDPEGQIKLANADENEYKKLMEKFILRATTKIGLVTHDDELLDKYPAYEGLLFTENVLFEEAVDKWMDLTSHGTLVMTEPVKGKPGQVIEVYRSGLGHTKSLFDSKVIPNASRDDIHGDSFQGFHRRFEWLMHFFIESCSAISYNNNWSIYVAYICNTNEMPSFQRDEILQRIRHEDAGDEPEGMRIRRVITRSKQGEEETLRPNVGRHAAAFVSVHSFPGLIQSRERVSQFFTMPTFQGLGLASMLLGHIYDYVADSSSIREMSVEDPALAFTQLRDYCGLEFLLRRKIISGESLFPSFIYDQDKDHSDLSPDFAEQNDNSLLRMPDPRHALPNESLGAKLSSSSAKALPPPLFATKKPVKKSLFGGASSLNMSGALGGGSSGPSVFTSAITKRDPTASVRRLHFLLPYLEHAYDLARCHLKESEMECTRLVEMLLVAKYLPKDAFTGDILQKNFTAVPPKKKQKIHISSAGDSAMAGSHTLSSGIVDAEGARSYRHCSTITEAIAKKWAYDPCMDPAKLLIKMRILKMQDLDPNEGRGQQMTMDQLILYMFNKPPITHLDPATKKQIQSEYLSCFYSYLRSIFKLRKNYFPLLQME